MENRFFSIGGKLKLFVVGVVLLVAAGLLAIFYHVFCGEVDERSYERLWRACYNVEEVLSDSLLWDIRETFLSEEYQALRTQTLETGDDTPIREWMDQHVGAGLAGELENSAEELREMGYTLKWEYENVYQWLDLIRDSFDLNSLSLQYDLDGVTYNLVDPNEDLFWPGSVEEPLPEFEELGDNAMIPPTYSKSKYGWLCTVCNPITDLESGEVICFVGAEIDMNDIVRDRYAFFMQSGVLVLLLIGVAVALSTIFAGRVAKPITQLTRAAKSFSGDDSGLTKDKVISLDIRSRDEIGELYHEIRSMEERIVNYTDHLTRITAEKERTETELRTAAGIQTSMLPEIDASITERAEFELAASMTPAKEVGGDFYDFFLIDADHLALVIADVSDKGVPAALFMMSSKILLNYRARLGGSPAEILSDVNVELCRHNPSSMFVTVWLGILELSTGRLSCSSAGHEYPFLRQNGRFALYKDRHGLMVGARTGVRYRDYEIQLMPGDAVFVYTDGVPEAQNAQGEFFGLERTEETLNAAPQQSAESILDALKQTTDSFKGDARQFDDRTMLCMIYTGLP